MGKLKDLLKGLFTIMQSIADGTVTNKDLPDAAEFLNRVLAACAICSDSREDIRDMKRKMSGIASSMARTCDIGDAQKWRNTAAALVEDLRGASVRRF